MVDLHCRPGSPFEDDDRELARALIAEHVQAGQCVMMFDAAELVGFMCWIRTDRYGADCVRAFGFSNLIHLAIPIALTRGPIVVITFDAICAGARPEMIWRIYRGVKAANPDAHRLATFMATRRGAPRWVERRFPS